MEETMSRTNTTIGFLTFCLIAVGAQLSHTSSIIEDEEKDKIDDWEYVIETENNELRFKRGIPTNAVALSAPKMQVMAEAMKMSVAASPVADSLGFSVGGAKDADNFFQNLEEGYLPRYSSLTYEGLFYDYTFDTGQQESCESLFCPSYARGVSKDLFSGTTDYYLSVGLNSGLTEESFQRKTLNLVVVLDISGSMSSPFNSYYYDTNGTAKHQKEEAPKSKMEIANQAIVSMLGHLKDSDRFSIVLFDNQGYRAKPLREVGKTNMQAISNHILDLRPRGGTNMGAGLQKGIEQFATISNSLKDPNLYENRIIFLTDAMPNRGELSKGGLFSMVKNAAKSNIFTSFIGIGVDFNPDLVEHITKTRGANYYAVHSNKDFKKRMDEEFDFMVTPLVFNLELQLSSNDYEIVGVFGSPEANLATGQMLKINTLFPSSTEEEEVRGGVVLVKLRKTGHSNSPIRLKVSYDDRSGKTYSNSNTVQFNPNNYHWDNKGIQKAVLLSEYVSLLKNWLLDSRKACNDSVLQPFPCFPYYREGLINPDSRPEWEQVKTWEQTSCTLEVSEGYQKLFSIFRTHFAGEMTLLQDSTLQKELDVLDRLIRKNNGKKMDDWRVQ
jgi:Ca-activated chloride channel family protein